MNRPFDGAAAIAALAATRPAAVALAEIVSLAVTVERSLLREARLSLPGAGPETEADLYFSDLVRDHNPARLVLRPEAAHHLRLRLAADPARLEQAWQLVSARHEHISATTRTEELLQWHALRGDTPAVRELLRACVSTLVDAGRPGFAAWAIDAIGRMDPAVRELEEYRMLGIGAAMRTGGQRDQLAALAGDRLGEWLDWLAPEAPERTELGLTLVESGIEFGPASEARYSQRISLPARFPQVIEVREGGGKTHALALRANAPAFLETASDDLTITAEDGTRMRVRPRGQRFIKEIRQPWVHLTYEAERFGGKEKVELPFVIGVVADLGGHTIMTRTPLEAREFREIGLDNFDLLMSEVQPQLQLAMPNEIAGSGALTCSLRFRAMADFGPDRIGLRVPEIKELLAAREALRDLMADMDGKESVQEKLRSLLGERQNILAVGQTTDSRFGRPSDSQRRRAREQYLLGEVADAIATMHGFMRGNPDNALPSDEEFLSHLNRVQKMEKNVEGTVQNYRSTKKTFRGNAIIQNKKQLANITGWKIIYNFSAPTEKRRFRFESAIGELCSMLSDYPELNHQDPFDTIEAVIARLDDFIGRQINHILAHPAYRKLESAWRGLEFLVNRTATGPNLKIKVLNIAREELLEAARCRMPLAPDGARGLLFREIYEAQFGELGGEPFTAIICDFAFGDGKDDLDILDQLGTIGKHARTTFIAAAAPAALELESWDNLADPRDLDPERLTLSGNNARTQTFRKTDAARHIVLTLPGMVGRLAWSDRENPVEAFSFNETAPPLLISAAWGLGHCIARACGEYGWPARIRGVESGGTVDGLATATFEGDVRVRSVEVMVSDRRHYAICELGMTAIVGRLSSDQATFLDTRTLYKPPYDWDPQTRQCEPRLTYELVHSRFAHYLMCIARDQIGAGGSIADLEANLKLWVSNWIDYGDKLAEPFQAQYPLRRATVGLMDDGLYPNHVLVDLAVGPSFQFDGPDNTVEGHFWVPVGS